VGQLLGGLKKWVTVETVPHQYWMKYDRLEEMREALAKYEAFMVRLLAEA
jgi:hypothetical protein